MEKRLPNIPYQTTPSYQTTVFSLSLHMATISHDPLSRVPVDDVVPELRVTPMEEELNQRIAQADAKREKDAWTSKIDFELLLYTMRSIAPFLPEDKLLKLTTMIHVGTVPVYRDDVLSLLRETTINAPHAYRNLSDIIHCAGHTLAAYRTLPCARQEWQEWMDSL